MKNKPTACVLAVMIAASACVLGAAGAPTQNESRTKPTEARSITVASHYFGQYHPNDPRNLKERGRSWDEWELIKAAKPRFPGHQQPKVPLWGYQEESDPKVMAQKIAAAADHGIDAFIFDWYHYNDGPFLDRPVDEDFLKATNNHRIKFAFMWANHDWIKNLFPYKKGDPQTVLYPGSVTPESFEKITDHVVLPKQQTDYNEVRAGYFKYWDQAGKMFNLPFFPNISMGWDPSPRCDQSDTLDNSGYPFIHTIGDNTPDNLRTALEMTKQRLLAQPDTAGPRILTINCWNEWTEGSYLELDTVNGTKYLEAVQEVFRQEDSKQPNTANVPFQRN